ncbi:hypothetical protein Sfulv_46460 [Streptomyces fulvorobeus]|uniref:Uncharacterized protein n=1 Tax=Streptomyces fulvorobeus TaxID=284028 RepID=A0A7J0CBC8_9ACTN|nr:hypothetical protein Sfulv_46460 [Streptomyces fulvorobeus]
MYAMRVLLHRITRSGTIHFAQRSLLLHGGSVKQGQVMVEKPESDTETKERRIDLSVPQVAGSAVAAVAAAVMASQLGVYGTILGAGVMSVVATCGGSVFQHFFRRTGEQIREVTVQVKHPAGRQVTVRTRETTPARYGRQRPADDRTTVLRTVRTDPGRTQEPDLDRTRPLGRADPADGGADDAYSGATTHGTRVRGWRKPILAAVAVFALAMLGITAFELVSGNDLSGGRGTTFGSVVQGGDHGPAPDEPAPRAAPARNRARARTPTRRPAAVRHRKRTRATARAPLRARSGRGVTAPRRSRPPCLPAPAGPPRPPPPQGPRATPRPLPIRRARPRARSGRTGRPTTPEPPADHQGTHAAPGTGPKRPGAVPVSRPAPGAGSRCRRAGPGRAGPVRS